ncbi:MAG: type IX secretion system membrane protein PorP/SprF [Sporocytophaga sp.]|nr:type IX secretion system membrane protein PorP/SprF [Sporocytophaga sp.]
MIIRLKIVFFVLFAISWNGAAGQDIQFSQFYGAPLYVNPAFAGSTHKTRLVLHQRIQWPKLDGKYITSLFSADTYFSKYRSGLGLQVYKDWQGSNTINSTDVSLSYSYEIFLTSKIVIRPGLQLGYISRTLDYSDLAFSYQYDNDGNIAPGFDNGKVKKQFMDLSTGAVIYTENLWVGFAANHINTPNQSFVNGKAPLPAKYSFTAGYQINFSRGPDKSTLQEEKQISLIPTVHYKFQGKSDQTDLGVYGVYDQLIAGFWYRGIPGLKRYKKGVQNNESIVGLVGWKYNNLAITYSYDFIVSRLVPARSGGAHEINLTYIFNKRKKIKPMRRMPCPHFYKSF